MVRIVKLYKYLTKSKSKDPMEDEEQTEEQTAAGHGSETNPIRLGKTLSDIITRRCIIGVLLMLILLPLLQVVPHDNSKYYGLQ